MKLIERIFWFFFQNRSIEKQINKTLEKIIFLKSDKKGFIIEFNDDRETIKANWNDFDDIKLSNENVSIIKNKKIVHIIDDSYLGWYQFIQDVPIGFDSYDYIFVEQFFNNLKGCQICGLLALKNDKCLACGSEVWNKNLLELFNSEVEYIKEEQLDMFEPCEDDPILLNNDPESGFKSDPNWIKVVTELELEKRRS